MSICSVFRRDFGHTAAPPPPVDPNQMFRGRQYEVNVLGNFPNFPTVSPFGTLQHPALIFSSHSQRIVGCIGGENLKHRLLWFQLKEGKKHVCSECGQVFKLVNHKTFHEVKHIVDPHTKQFFERYSNVVSESEKDTAHGAGAAADKTKTGGH